MLIVDMALPINARKKTYFTIFLSILSCAALNIGYFLLFIGLLIPINMGARHVRSVVLPLTAFKVNTFWR